MHSVLFFFERQFLTAHRGSRSRSYSCIASARKASRDAAGLRGGRRLARTSSCHRASADLMYVWLGDFAKIRQRGRSQATKRHMLAARRPPTNLTIAQPRRSWLTGGGERGRRQLAGAPKAGAAGPPHDPTSTPTTTVPAPGSIW